MVKKTSIVALVAAIVGVAAIAPAQGMMDAHKPTGLSARIGVFFPTDSAAGRTGWFAIGMDYRIAEVMSGMNRDSYSVSLDYAGHNNFRTVPLLVNATRHMGQVYITGGLGVSFSKRPVGLNTESKTEFAYTAGIGYEFQGELPIFVEARYLGNGRSELSGAVLSAGFRF
ncbi:hypothetical protein BH11ARM1_BH11ARM1_04440 [soil metagenome]